MSVYHHTPRIADTDPAADRLDDSTVPLTKEHFYELIGLRPLTQNQQNACGFHVATYVLLALQLCLSAVFIVLGSLRSVDNHVTIVILGGVSIRDDLSDVVFEAEEIYWDVVADRLMRVLQDERKAHPDTFAPAASKLAKSISRR
ncbi:hypothetical protein BST61_g251 [Cercospora zeina]